jgi:hypothetical protein
MKEMAAYVLLAAACVSTAAAVDPCFTADCIA